MCDKCVVCKKEQPAEKKVDSSQTIDVLMVDDSPHLVPLPSPPVVKKKKKKVHLMGLFVVLLFCI